MNSILETVCLICNGIRNVTKQGVSFQQLLTTIRREFVNNNLHIKFRSSRKKYLGVEEFYVNAYYDAEDDAEGDVCIEVIVFHNFDKTVVWDKQQISDLLKEIFDAVVHEYKHQRQARRRNYKTYWPRHNGNYHYQLYLTDPDEIDAYAFSIAIELCRALGKFRALRYMSRISTLARFKLNGRFVSPNLNAYVSHFDANDPILRSIIKKVYVRTQKIDTDFIFV